MADENAGAYTDLALLPSSDEEQNDMDIIQVFKDVIPQTHGAPVIARKPDIAASAPVEGAD
jgi:hypothetical protein